MSAIVAGMIAAAAELWTSRATTSTPSDGASPTATEAATNIASPTAGAQRVGPVRQRSSGQEQSGKHEGVTVHHPLQSGDPTTEVMSDRRQRR